MLSLLYAADTALGRLDYHSLSDQTLMEMLTEGLNTDSKKCLQDKNKEYLDVCEWKCVECDSELNVTQIHSFYLMGGTLALSYAPPKVIKIAVVSCQIFGTVETADLPRCLVTFNISFNNFSGTLDCGGLPAALEMLDVSGNIFTGSCDLTALPKGLKGISVAQNLFTGTISLASLPDGIQDICLIRNDFSGTLDFENIPSSLRHFSCCENSFTGEFRFANPKDARIDISAMDNRFSGTAIVARRTPKVFLGSTGVTAVVDEDGNAHPNGRQILQDVDM